MNYLICCNDAGGSEVVAAWVQKNSQYTYRFILKGPAVKIFKRVLGDINNTDVLDEKLFYNIDFLLTGTSWSTTLELECIHLAKKKKIPSASYLDHWVNYRERFSFPKIGWERNLPDEIWYGDEYALPLLLTNGFEKEILKYVPNEYFRTLKENFDKSTSIQYKYLYVCEPVADHMKELYGDPMYLGYDEFSAMESFFQRIKPKEGKILIRLHPSEEKGKYEYIINKYSSSFDIEYSKHSTLVTDINLSEKVVGCESMAMVMAVLAEKEVYTLIPISKNKCRLPFDEIKELKLVIT